MLWIVSEICYYLGLTLAALFVPALTIILWIMSLVDKADPNYWHLLTAWVLSGFMLMVGVLIKRRIQGCE